MRHAILAALTAALLGGLTNPLTADDPKSAVPADKAAKILADDELVAMLHPFILKPGTKADTLTWTLRGSGESLAKEDVFYAQLRLAVAADLAKTLERPGQVVAKKRIDARMAELKAAAAKKDTTPYQVFRVLATCEAKAGERDARFVPDESIPKLYAAALEAKPANKWTIERLERLNKQVTDGKAAPFPLPKAVLIAPKKD